MDRFKIEILKGKKIDLKYSEVNGNNLSIILEEIISLTKFKAKSRDAFFTQIRARLSNELSVKNIENPNLIKIILEELKIAPSTKMKCYVVWNYPEEIDLFELNELKQNWKHIWYPLGDDAVILYIQKRKALVMISHFGEVRYEVF